MDSGTILRDLTLVVLTAAVVTLLFYRLKLPVILGYLLAGLLIGPQLPELPSIHDKSAITQLSQLGVVFLMFSIGLEFDLARLKKVFWPAFIAVILQSALVFYLGTLSAQLVGYTPLEGIFLGALLTNSASLVCIKVLSDKGRLKRADAHMAIGILIFEDIIAVMLLVVLTGVAATHEFDLDSVYQTTFLVGIFVVGIYYLGRLIAPFFSKFLKQTGSAELLTIATIAFVLGVGELARISSFSIALGAFLAGAILAQSRISKEIERVSQPFRDLFSAVFFVTIGMLIEPQWLIENWVAVLFIAGMVILVKIGTCWLGLFVGGQSSETGFRAAISKASVGEFGFIIAAMGQGLGVTGPGLTSMTVGLAIVTYLFIPVVNAKPGLLYSFISDKTPERLRLAADIYSKMLDSVGRMIGKSVFLRLARRPLLQIGFQFLLLNGIVILAYVGAEHLETVKTIQAFHVWVQLGVWLVAGTACLPFLAAIIRNLDALIHLVTDATIQTGRNKQFITGKMANFFHTMMLCLVIVLFGGLYLSAASRFFPSGVALVVFLVMVGSVMVLFWKSIINLNSRLEYLFLQSFQQNRVDADPVLREAALREAAAKHPWPASVETVKIEPHTVPCGKLISELRLREQTGSTIIAVSRGGITHYDPSPELPIFPNDHLILFGTEKQVQDAQRLLTIKGPPRGGEEESPEFSIEKVFIGTTSPLAGDTLAGAEVRTRHKISVLGIQRGHVRITSPSASEILLGGDVLLVVGPPNAIETFKQTLQPEEEEISDAEDELLDEEVDEIEVKE